MSGARSRPARTTSKRSGPQWPDLMIGAVTLALLAGFGALLLGERQQPAVTQLPPSTPAIPASPGTVPEPQPAPTTPAPAAQTTSPSTTTPSTTPPAATTPPAVTAPNATSTTPSATNETTTAGTTPAATQTAPGQPAVAQTTEIPPVPQSPPVEPIKPPVLPEQPSATQPTTAQPTATQTPSTQSAATQSPATAPASIPATPPVTPRAAAIATSENRVPLRSDYRISLGSFNTRKTVETQTSGVRGLGYTVHAIDLGDQYVAQIGPFSDEATARRALADIQRTYPGALLYRPRNAAQSTETAAQSTESSAATQSSTSTSSAENTSSTSQIPARPQSAAPSGPTYIQVGAFDRAESAENLVSILKDNGFAPTVNSPEGKLTTVMVGPYSGDAVLRAEARLDNAGLEHFRIR